MENSPHTTGQGTTGFAGLGIKPKILEILHRLGFSTPTPIQHKAIPIALDRKDLIGIAQTGTGKTLAFAVPILQGLTPLRGRALIILPTRELAIQVDETFLKIGRPFGLKTAVLIGGAPMGGQIRDIRNNPNVVIATPGRLIDHLQQRTLHLQDIGILVLDEADRMLDMGFAPQIRQILRAVPVERQTMLFSATMPDDIVRIATMHMKLPVRIEIARPGTTVERVEQEVFIVPKMQKNRLLEALLQKYSGTVLVFSRTKYGAKKICGAVRHMGHTTAEIHSNRSLSQRRDALSGFQSGKYRVLVATDIAARGIDVKNIELVINYDIPEDAEDYVHRIGRTARAGKTGRAITFAMPDQSHKIRGIERLIRMALRISKLPELPPDRTPAAFSGTRGRPISKISQQKNTYQHWRDSNYLPQRRNFFKREIGEKKREKRRD
ncbi:DEAD/DEAH box helicase [Candidatus Peregrinibacteria bacterium]|nr:DEAD/DEAH box helicase [Candidatus Peregrinibacteria bacterium]